MIQNFPINRCSLELVDANRIATNFDTLRPTFSLGIVLWGLLWKQLDKATELPSPNASGRDMIFWIGQIDLCFHTSIINLWNIEAKSCLDCKNIKQIKQMNLLEGVGTTRLDLSTVFAVPDPNSLPLHTKLQTCKRIFSYNCRYKSWTQEPWH